MILSIAAPMHNALIKHMVHSEWRLSLANAIAIQILPRMSANKYGKEQAYNTKSNGAQVKIQNAC